MGRRQTGGGGVILWEMFCCESLVPAMHVDATLPCSRVREEFTREVRECVFAVRVTELNLL